MRERAKRVLSAIGVLGACATLCAGTRAQAPAVEGDAVVPGRLERVVVMGASLAAGYGADRTFVQVLESTLLAPRKPVLDLGDLMFFVNPPATGQRQVGAALDADPTLLVAIDFLFWFGYGTIDAKGGPIELEAERLELLERGLALLEEFECPLVLGDFPDMSAAVGRMLTAAQMPEKTTLPLLSRRVREWAAEREDVIVLPLSEIVARLGSGKEIQIGRHAFPAGAELLQPDRLHPTLEGLAAVAQLLADELVAAKLARAEDFRTDLTLVLAEARKGRAPPPAAVPAGTPR